MNIQIFFKLSFASFLFCNTIFLNSGVRKKIENMKKKEYNCRNSIIEEEKHSLKIDIIRINDFLYKNNPSLHRILFSRWTILRKTKKALEAIQWQEERSQRCNIEYSRDIELRVLHNQFDAGLLHAIK